MSYYDEFGERATEVSELFDDDRPEIGDYYSYYDDEVERLWNEMPGGMTEGQIEAHVDMTVDMDLDEWEDILAAIEAGEFDYWDWFNDQYVEG